MATTLGHKVSKADLQYAEEVMEVYRMGDNALATLGTRHIEPSFRRLYEWVQNPENYDTFIKTMVPKATDILSKHRAPEEQGAVITAERKGISELQEFLRQHVAESQVREENEQPTREQRSWINPNKPATIHPSLRAGVSSETDASEPDGGSGDQCSSTEQERTDAVS